MAALYVFGIFWVSEMYFELYCLVVAIFIGITHLSLDSFAYKAQVGNAYTLTGQDDNIARTHLAGRMRRANRNFTENFALFTAAIILVHVTNAQGDFSYWGAAIWVLMRLLYVPAYIWVFPWVRTIIWQVSMVALLLIIWQLFA